ncbi:hypothetical protein EDS67_25250 [candidate division KSB1 bacterium]|nr:MAG: hypothetical protein EDS67_25250 [candidate division KSB1 bacterium]MBC6949935.1 hypothetical protein [candidate division KSB1 bacterium]MCE7944605.1 hypothetical protein [Chlorobi bacterium CHB1]MDL1875637.1 hypothetical protein [Cytophagia bacterium CHB2]RIK70197.1 MAG: hypothetical protein DCC62_22995 [candidate division KSB1 bacterium]
MKKLLLAVLAILLLSVESFAGAWTLPKKRLWLKSAIFYQSTDRRFCTQQDALSPAFREAGCTSAGHRAPFDPFIGGASEAVAIFAEAAYGATGWLEVGVQIPFYSLQFTNLANPRRPRSNSIGDVRFFTKLRLLQQPFVASLTVGAKSPAGKFTVDAEAVNVSEGQWDFDVLGEVSRSLWPLRGYVSLGVGYRMRTDNDAFEHTMGDELMALAEASYELSSHVMIKSTLDWLRGQAPRLKVNNAPLLERRELLTITPSMIYALREGLNLEAAVRFALSGQDFPDGHQLMAAVSYGFSVP